MCLAYLVSVRGVCLADAYEYLQLRRPVIQVNTHFLYQLAALEVRFCVRSSALHLTFKISQKLNMLCALRHLTTPLM
jgi:hypothetical protein